jgi:stearoyl-CoA desaturase (delta-9 desaturase)
MPDQAATVPIAPHKSEKIRWLQSTPFFAIHVAAVVGVVAIGWSWSGVALAAALYYVRMFGLTAGYHRYFSHRSYRTSRVFQFLMALLGCLCVQKGPLWWAAHHRHHHKYSDEPEDVHSVKQSGFWFSHVKWILVQGSNPTHWDRVKDISVFPELRWLNKHYMLPPVALAALLFGVGGTWALVWGFLVSTTVLWHGTFTVNSLAHLFGRRRYETGDDSRNSFLIALITCGEGWHNNHHFYQRSERQGFYWWELDISHYVLTMFSWVGLVWDLHGPPGHVREAHRNKAESSEKAEKEAPADGVIAIAPETPQLESAG